MEKKTYLEKLKDPRWQKKRLEVLERDHWECVSCGSKDETLHVHHLFYFYGKEPWDIPIAKILNLIWTNGPFYGSDGRCALSNAYYILKPD